MVGDPFCPRTRGGAEWTIRSLHDQPLVSLKYLVPRLPRLAVEQDEVIAHGNRRLPPPCDGTVKQHLDGPGKPSIRGATPRRHTAHGIYARSRCGNWPPGSEGFPGSWVWCTSLLPQPGADALWAIARFVAAAPTQRSPPWAWPAIEGELWTSG